MKDLMRMTFSRVKGNSCGRLTTIFIPGKFFSHFCQIAFSVALSESVTSSFWKPYGLHLAILGSYIELTILKLQHP